MIESKKNWSNSSVKLMAGMNDPIDILTTKIRKLIYKAVEEGYSGPPFDPFDFAQILGIKTRPNSNVNDAQIISEQDGSFRIEFNPSMARSRIKFSIAHEIAHTFFPDCAETVRMRMAKDQVVGNAWELEMLCNIGAAEILMPIGSFPTLKEEELTINNLLRLRREFEVSIETVLLRSVKLTDEKCFAFAVSRDENVSTIKFNLDYFSPSSSLHNQKKHSIVIPMDTDIAQCIAIGVEASCNEEWIEGLGSLHIECVGLPPYPGKKYPRIVGIAILNAKERIKTNSIKYVVGDATTPQCSGIKIIAHIVNDRARKWGGRGFATYVSKKWPEVYRDFIDWCKEDLYNFSLGNCRLCRYSKELYVFSMVCQEGYGRSRRTRVRYNALELALGQLCEAAHNLKASVHMPRIGCGHGGGDWKIVSELIDEHLIKRGINVTVYDLHSQYEKVQNSVAFGTHLFGED